MEIKQREEIIKGALDYCEGALLSSKCCITGRIGDTGYTLQRINTALEILELIRKGSSHEL